MRWTIAIRQAVGAAEASTRNTGKSRKVLSLMMSYKLPQFGMDDFVSAMGGSAYLLSVGTPSVSQTKGGSGGSDSDKTTAAISSSDLKMFNIPWLQFLPEEYRPKAHVVAASHVLAPHLWREFYPVEEFLYVRQENCRYSLDVYEQVEPRPRLCNLELTAEPFHHPEGIDLAIIHLKDETKSLETLKSLGVEILRLRDPKKLFQVGEELCFEGYFTDDLEKYNKDDQGLDVESQVYGKILGGSSERLFASTSTTLALGFCGGPVLDKDGEVCGTTIGHVPTDYKDKILAGCGVLAHNITMHGFVDFVERAMVERLMPNDLFAKIKVAKETAILDANSMEEIDDKDEIKDPTWDEIFDEALIKLKKHYTPEEVNKILDVVEARKEKMLKKDSKDGENLDELNDRLLQKTLEIQALVHDQFRQRQQAENMDNKGTSF